LKHQGLKYQESKFGFCDVTMMLLRRQSTVFSYLNVKRITGFKGYQNGNHIELS